MDDLARWPLADGPFEAGALGLVIQSAPTVDEWLAYGARIRKVDKAIQWVIGDWLNYGEAAYGEAYSQAFTMWPDVDYGRLRDYKWVSKAIPMSFRNDNLSWTHHRIVAKMAPKSAGRWLRLADDVGMSAAKLREEIAPKEERETHACPICGKLHKVPHAS